MKKVLIVLLITVALLGGCTRADETPAMTNPVDIVKAVIEASNSDDIEKYLSLLADDFTFIQNPPGTKIEGKAKYEETLKTSAAWKHHNTVTSDYEVDGDKVSCTLRETGDDLRIMGLSEVNAGCEYQVRDGKILSLTVTVDSKDWDKIIEFSSGGIGINIKFNDEGAVVEKLAENSPAAEAGIKPGDIITAVDGVSYSQMREGELALRIRGKIGSKVQLSLKRGDSAETIDIEVTRVDMSQLIFSSSPASTMPEDRPGVPTLVDSGKLESPGQSEKPAKFDIVRDGLNIRYLADGYRVELIRETAFGLPGQLSRLPSGDIVITDTGMPRIQILSEGQIKTIVEDNNIIRRAATAMPDGRVCYGMQSGEIMVIDPNTGVKEALGKLDPVHSSKAFAADSNSNVYVVTTLGYLYRFSPDNKRTLITDSLPFADVGYKISDIAVAADGTSYVSGWNYFVSVSPEGKIKVITDDLHSEPTFCDIDPDGNVYIKDIFSGTRRYSPKTGILAPLHADNIAIGDMLAVSSKEFVFVQGGIDSFCSYNIEKDTYTPMFVNPVNSWAFAADGNNSIFLSTPYLDRALNPYMVRISSDGNQEDIPQLTFDYISAADVDSENRLCIFTYDAIYRLEKNGNITSIPLQFPGGGIIEGVTDIASGQGETWYGITTNNNDSIRVWRTDTTGKVVFLPISFNKDSFDGVYRVGCARIDVNQYGQLLIFVDAPVTNGKGPLIQRVYRANDEGTGLTEITALDSGRICGMVDVAAGPEGDIFVLSGHEGYDAIHHIDSNNEMSDFLSFDAGRDLKSIDVDPQGNLWFCSTLGVFRVHRD